MKVITTYHPSSSVQYSVKATLTADPELEFLVVGKLDKLQVYSIQPEGLKLECTLELWGRVMAITAIPRDVSLILHDEEIVLMNPKRMSHTQIC